MQNKRMTLLYVSLAVACFAINSAQAAEVVIISEAKEGNPVKLNCSTDGPYSWTYNGDPIKNANLSIYDVINSDMIGNYSCESGSSGLITYEAINFAKPVIDHGERSITVTEGDTNVSLTCISKSSTPVTFYWKMENTVWNTTKNNGTKSVLTISEVYMSTKANYWCYAENAAGKGNTTILVRVQSRLAPLWPFLGILAEVGLMAILTLIFAKREKNKQRRNGRSASLAQSNDTPQRGGSKEE